MREIRLEHLTSPEIAAALDEGWTRVIVACGAVEQHGPHLALSMDAAHGDRLAVEVAERLGRTLVAPTIRVGCSEHHMAFRGTISLERDTFLAVCADYARSLARHGFRRVLFLPTHGGNFQPLKDGLASLREAAGPDCEVRVYADLAEVIETWRAVAEREAGLGERVGGHADLAETSIMLALHPDRVRTDRVEQGHMATSEERPALIERILREGFATITPNGILGDARGATAGLGRAFIDELADVAARAFADG